MPSAAENFLKQKRQQQQNGAMLDITVIAPSPNRRLGVDDMGGYKMESGHYTGKGPDNITQRQVPTQRRIDANGNPYYVDENEVVVVDSETLNEYGGPEALNKFIQENRPGRQFYRGGVPTSQGYTGGMGSGTSMPISQANGMAQGQSGYRQYYGGGIPTKQYYGGGIPTKRRNYAISPEQKEMLTEIDGMARQYQDGGTPTRDRTVFDKTKIPKPNTPNIPGGNQAIKNLPNLPDTMIPNMNPDNKGMVQPFGLNKPKEIHKFDPKDLKKNIVNPNIKNSNVGDPIKIDLGVADKPDDVSGQIFKPDQKIVPDPVVSPTPDKILDQTFTVPDEQQGQTTPVETKPPVYSPSDYDEMIANRYLGRMGAQQEAQRAAEAQRGMQAGLSEREVMGRGAIGDVGRREAMAGATSDFAIDAARRAEEKDKWQQQFDLQQKQFDTQNQEKALQTMLASGDYDGAAKMFNDIYGNSIDFTHLKDELNAKKFNEGFNNMNQLISTGTSWEDAVKIMQQDGSFEKMGMTEGDLQSFYKQAQLNNDPLYKAMKMTDSWVEQGLMTQDQADDFTAFLLWSVTNPQGVTITDGYTVKDENGNEVGFFKTEEEANNFIKENPNKNYTSEFIKDHVTAGGTTGTSTGQQQGEKLDNAIEYLTNIGATNVDPVKVQQFLDENNGTIPSNFTLNDWQKWDNTTGSFSNINNYLSGDLTTQLTSADKNLLADIEKAKIAVKEGNATDEQKELASKVQQDFSNWTYGTNANKTSKENDFAPGGGMGRLHKKMKYNSEIYNVNGARDVLTFNDDTKKWVENNKGNVVQIDGKYYQINASDPIKEKYNFENKAVTSGNDTYEQKFKADALVVTNLETGETEYLTFGSEGILTD